MYFLAVPLDYPFPGQRQQPRKLLEALHCNQEMIGLFQKASNVVLFAQVVQIVAFVLT
jgi:hypothetical protein